MAERNKETEEKILEMEREIREKNVERDKEIEELAKGTSVFEVRREEKLGERLLYLGLLKDDVDIVSKALRFCFYNHEFAHKYGKSKVNQLAGISLSIDYWIETLEKKEKKND